MRKPRDSRSLRRVAALAAAGSLGALTVASMNASAAGTNTVTLSVTSDQPGAVAEVVCTFTIDGEVQEQTQAGALPMDLTLSGGAVDCTVTSDQPVQVMAKDANGNRNRVQSSGGTIRLRLAAGS